MRDRMDGALLVLEGLGKARKLDAVPTGGRPAEYWVAA
jgi:hypothetical protein